MGKGTGIQWCDDTVNPTSGCDGCELWTPGKGGPCYAGNLHEARLAKSLPMLYDPSFENVRLIPGRMAKAVAASDLAGKDRPDKPWLNGHRRMIFVGDLSDIFSNAVPFEFLKSEIIDIARSRNGQRHDLLLLTKRPRRAAEFARWLERRGEKWPDNVWAGTSITNRASLSRAIDLVDVPARVRFLSMEPLIEEIPTASLKSIMPNIRWMIVGGESDQGEHLARPFDVEWAISLWEMCAIIRTRFFLKQLGSHVKDASRALMWPSGTRSDHSDGYSRVMLDDRHGGNWNQWPNRLRIREIPR